MVVIVWSEMGPTMGVFIIWDLKYSWPCQTWSNLGAALVSMAEAHASSGNATGAAEAYEQAMAAYAQASSMCHSELGGDLPGLLHDWGVALLSLATHSQVNYSTSGDRTVFVGMVAHQHHLVRRQLETGAGKTCGLYRAIQTCTALCLHTFTLCAHSIHFVTDARRNSCGQAMETCCSSYLGSSCQRAETFVSALLCAI